MNVVQKNFRFTIVIVSAMVLTIWVVFALSTKPKKPDHGVQVLPSSLNKDDIQYYPPGPEFRLARQAAAIRQAAEAEASQQETEDEAKSLMMMVTPQIIIQEEEEEDLRTVPP